jgi:2-polyprenyl-3-methyl-5-hydroxy-6-metoxy-1,4-benzoquinol methylase
MPRVPLPSQENLKERTIQGLHEFLVSHLPDIPRAACVWDIGCGTGAWLQRLADSGFTNLQGIDQDTAQFRATGASCSRANLDWDDWGLGENNFRLITAIEVIEHLENPGRFWLNISRHLANDGWLLLTTPNVFSVHARLRFLLNCKLKHFDDKGDQTHIYPVLITSLERILPRYHLHIAERFSFPPSGSPTSRLLLRMASFLIECLVSNRYPGDVLCFLIQGVTRCKCAS